MKKIALISLNVQRLFLRLLRPAAPKLFATAAPEAYKNYIEEVESPVSIENFELLDYLTN